MYLNNKNGKLQGIIPLENVRVRSVEDKDGKQWILEIYSEMSDIIKGCKTDSSGTVVQGNHKYYR
jgi:IMP cyclohydrolase